MSFHLDGRYDIEENHRSRPSAFVEINMTPFVDVCLVLLIIFMVTAPFAVSGVNVKLPSSESKKLSLSSKFEVISVTKSGLFYIGKTPVKENELVQKLKNIFKDTTEPPSIFIRADKDVPYGKVMTAMSAAQNAGIQKIGMMGEHKTQNAK